MCVNVCGYAGVLVWYKLQMGRVHLFGSARFRLQIRILTAFGNRAYFCGILGLVYHTYVVIHYYINAQLQKNNLNAGGDN
jgi:hypothetical protein